MNELQLKEGRFGGAILTFTGKTLYPLDPRPEEICIEDIAHALSNTCRFNGHIPVFYSVAEHSVRVVDHLAAARATREERLWGLLHDASEFALADIVAPIKPYLEDYTKFEANLMSCICAVFGLPTRMPANVHLADKEVYAIEARDLRSGKPPLAIKRPVAPKAAEAFFLQYFQELGGRRVL